MIYDAPDWCHHSGIVRPALPVDDEITDVAAWLAARFDAVAYDVEQYETEAGLR